MPASEAGASSARHCIYLIDEDDAGCVFLCFREEIPDSGSSHSDEHLHEVGARDGKERHSCLSRHCLCQQGLTGTGRAHEYHTLGYPGSHCRIFGRTLEEVHYLLEILFLFHESGHVLEGYLSLSGSHHPGSALPEIHHAAAAGSSAGLGIRHGEDDHERRHSDDDRYSVHHEEAFPCHFLFPVARIKLLHLTLCLSDIRHIESVYLTVL